ncbi:MAG: DUF72 domain-containing protein [Deltaproteobacteria bacterium HGW-Deltaproteobacteria-6]|nr:MAG: DUF72 domain-containing protein [Deltaproteobacteria bacterium HGW-Deltaproteobacteria-6]
MKFYIGTSGYGYKEWKGRFYPEKISPHDMLGFYAGHLGAVEMNNTFYHMPTDAVLTSWTRQVPADFIFAFKAPRIITHYKRLKDVGAEISYFFRTLTVLHSKLGPVLFQFPDRFQADHKQLEDFLILLPAWASCAFEFRSPSWFTDMTLQLLRAKNCSLCITDTDEHPAGAIASTAPWGYLRLRRSDYTDADLSLWLKKIRLQKWKAVFVFFKHEAQAKGPELAMRFRKLAETSDT